MKFTLLSLLPLLTISNIHFINKSTSITSINDLISTKEDIKSYYKDLEGLDLKGDEFLSSLQNILKKNQTKADYNGGSTSWYDYFLLDRNYDLSPLTTDELNKLNNKKKSWWNGDNVYCDILYEENPHKFIKSETNGKNKYQIDREHIYPKSYGFNMDNDGYKNLLAGCDMHNLHMGEGLTNRNIHSDLPYGNIDKNKVEGKSSLSDKVGSYKGYSSITNSDVIEPLLKDKGDIARSIFYMAARYHNYEEIEKYGPTPRLLLSDTPYKIKDTVSPLESKDNPTYYGVLKDLLSWNLLDEVNNHEIIRNDLCYKYIQHNRNPFIDYPLWADIAFNEDTNYQLDLSSSTGVKERSKLNLTWSNYKENYNSNEVIDLSSITYTYNDENIDKNKIKITYFNRLTPDDIKILDNTSLVLDDGYYEFNFTYIENNSKSIKYIKVGEPIETYNIDLSNIKNNYISNDVIDLSTLNTTYKIGNKTINIDNKDLIINIIHNDETIKITDTKYKLGLYGDYKLDITYKDFKNKEYKNIVDIKVNLSTVYIITLIAFIILLILIFIISIIVNSKKKRRKYKSKKYNKKNKNSKKKTNKK